MFRAVLQLDPTYEYLWDGKARLFVSKKEVDEEGKAKVVMDSRGVGRLTVRKHKDTNKNYVIFTTENVSTGGTIWAHVLDVLQDGRVGHATVAGGV